MNLKRLGHLYYRKIEEEEMELVYHKYLQMSSHLNEYEKQVYLSWCGDINQVCQMNLDQPLIKRDPSTDLLSVNVNQEVKNINLNVSQHKPLISNVRASNFDNLFSVFICIILNFFTLADCGAQGCETTKNP